MEGVGARLREAREARGMTVEAVAKVTRVPVASLQAIEVEDFASLPAPVFARGFVRAYAQAVGLDSAELLRSLRGTLGSAQTDQPLQPPSFGRTLAAAELASPVGDGVSGAFRSSWTVLLLIAVGMLLAAWLMVQGKHAEHPQAAVPPQPVLQAPVDGVTPALPDVPR